MSHSIFFNVKYRPTAFPKAHYSWQGDSQIAEQENWLWDGQLYGDNI